MDIPQAPTLAVLFSSNLHGPCTKPVRLLTMETVHTATGQEHQERKKSESLD